MADFDHAIDELELHDLILMFHILKVIIIGSLLRHTPIVTSRSKPPYRLAFLISQCTSLLEELLINP